MADLLFGDLGFIPVPKRKERQFRLRDDFSLTDFSDNELRSRYRFGPECIEFLVELLRDDLERPTSIVECLVLEKLLFLFKSAIRVDPVRLLYLPRPESNCLVNH